MLTPLDVDALFGTIRRLRGEGIGVVFISHKLREVVAIADRVTVLRRGRVVATQPIGGLDTNRLAELMIGHIDVADATIAPAVGAVGRSTCRDPVPDPEPPPDGRSGVGGPRRHARCRWGAPSRRGIDQRGARRDRRCRRCQRQRPDRARRRAVRHRGPDVGNDPRRRRRRHRRRPGRTHSRRIGRITEDRRGSVVPGLSVEQNLVLEDLDRFRRYGFTQRQRVRQHARRLIDEFDIRAEPHDAVAGLSGGNLQKVLLARALSRGPAPWSSPSRPAASTWGPTRTSTTSCAGCVMPAAACC